jgi:hypothetical protein
MTDRWEEWTWESMCMFHGMFALRVCVSRCPGACLCRSVSPVLAFRNTLLSIALYPLSLSLYRPSCG